MDPQYTFKKHLKICSPRSEDCSTFTSSLCEQLEMNNIADTNSHRGSRHSISDRTDSCSSLDSESFYAEKSLMFQSPEMVVDSGCQVVLWTWVSASGCAVIADSLPFWFSEGLWQFLFCAFGNKLFLVAFLPILVQFVCFKHDSSTK